MIDEVMMIDGQLRRTLYYHYESNDICHESYASYPE